MNNTVFITGITGYVGGTIAIKLKEKGYNVLGLVRKDSDIEALEKEGIRSVKGTLQDTAVLAKAIALSNAVIHTADPDDPKVAEDFISILKGTNKTFIYTSGAYIVSNWDRPETAEFVYTESFPLKTDIPAGNRVVINQNVLRSAIEGVRSIVIVPSMVYGTGLLLKKESLQIPLLIKRAEEKGVSVYIDKGAYSTSNVHVEDLADLYVAALEKAKAGAYFFAENGMTSFKDIATAIHHKLKLTGNPTSISKTEAAEIWGDWSTALFGSDVRLNADNARLFLDWKPKHSSVLDWINNY